MANEVNLMYDEAELFEESARRKKCFVELKVDNLDLEKYETAGWVVKKAFKHGTSLITKDKDGEEMFLDQIWTTLFSIGFKQISGPSGCFFDYKNANGEAQKKVDILAMDDETCLFVDCFYSDVLDRTISLTNEIKEIQESFRFLCAYIRENFGDRKCKFIIATKNIVVLEQTEEAMADAKIIHFTEENVDYYNALVNHLGTSARYQLLGNLFSKTTIAGMDSRVPAIEGRMGNLVYYSFLIEPERLLKIGYVLHRNKANHDQMPTYQRLIKKDRLKAIKKFVDEGGFFPNSIIISIDSSKNKMRFEKASQDLPDAHSRIGILYLPKEYQSAYIIDGQHRLYGYTDSRFASKDTIPVVAFVDLDKEKQVKMFMDINENQKPVSKTLRNILNVDLNWNSENFTKRREALIISLSQKLGESPDSPYYGRILTGEDSITKIRCITLEYVKTALEKTEFFNKYSKKNEIIERGILDKLDSDKTLAFAYGFIRVCAQVIADYCEDEWEKGSDGFLTINNTTVGVLRIIGDIAKLVVLRDCLSIDDLDADDLYRRCASLLADFAETLNELPSDTRNEIKTAKGGGAKDFVWRTLQVALHNRNPEFTNPDLEKYIEENCTDYNEVGLEEVLYIKERLISTIKAIIIEKIDWENAYFPEDLAIRLNQKLTAINIKNKRAGIEKELDIWSVLEFEDISKILGYRANWSQLFRGSFDRWASRVELVALLKSLQGYEAKINNGKQITKSEFEIIDQEFRLAREGKL